MFFVLKKIHKKQEWVNFYSALNVLYIAASSLLPIHSATLHWRGLVIASWAENIQLLLTAKENTHRNKINCKVITHRVLEKMQMQQRINLMLCPEKFKVIALGSFSMFTYIVYIVK